MRISLFLLSSFALSALGPLSFADSAYGGHFHTGDATQSAHSHSLFAPILIDFEDFAAGTYIVGDEWAEYGVSINVQSNRQRKDGSGSLPLRLFNSNCSPKPSKRSALPQCTGQDSDLATGEAFGTTPQGNVLIIQEDNSKRGDREDLGVPDDDTRGGLITFNFSQAVSILSFGFLDFDDRDRGEGFIRAYTGLEDTKAAITFNLSDLNYLVNPEHPRNNSLRNFNGFGEGTFQRLEVDYPGSGAVTHLEFAHEVAPGGSRYWLEKAEAAHW